MKRKGTRLHERLMRLVHLLTLSSCSNTEPNPVTFDNKLVDVEIVNLFVKTFIIVAALSSQITRR